MTHSLYHEQSAPASPELAALLARLEDPAVASGLQNLLDHVDLLAILVIGLDGLVSRSEVIGEALTEGITELREAAGDGRPNDQVDPAAIMASLVALGAVLPKLTPTITRVADEDPIGGMLDSGIVSPESLAHIGLLATAINNGAADAQAHPIQIGGVFSVMRQLKDPDIARGLGFTLSILKAVGRELASDAQKGQ